MGIIFAIISIVDILLNSSVSVNSSLINHGSLENFLLFYLNQENDGTSDELKKLNENGLIDEVFTEPRYLKEHKRKLVKAGTE